MRVPLVALCVVLMGTCAVAACGADPSSLGASSPPSGPTGPASSASALTPGPTAVAGTASTGPGQTSVPSVTPTSPQPAPSAVLGTVTVTEADNGRSLRLRTGQHLRVQLGASGATWDQPVSSQASVLLRRSSTGGYPSGQPVDATFDAVGRGQAQVSATTDATCLHGRPRCEIPQRVWHVQISVT